MRLFSINKNESAVLVTLIVVIFLASAYFFIYIPSNEKRVQEQRFRSMQNMDRNIHARIQNSIQLLNNFLTAYKREIDNNEAREYLRRYFTSYPKENFILTPIREIKVLPGPLHDTLVALDSTYSIEVNNLSKNINLGFRKLISRGNDTSLYSIGIQFSFEQFIKSLLPTSVFNEYIIFSNEEVIYETFPSGINYIKPDSVLLIKNGIAGSGVKNITVSGKDYKMFMQPIRFTNNKYWVIGGLLSNKRYQLEKNELPGRVVLLLVTIVLTIIVAFPWIKLYQMGNKDRLTIADGAGVISVSMLLMSLMSFSFFRYSPHFLSDDIPRSKDKLADQVTRAFENEIGEAYFKLRTLDSIRANDSILKQGGDVINLAKPNVSFRDKGSSETLKKVNDIIGGLSVRQVFWLNGSGYEIRNWITDSMNAPHGNYRNRNYYKNIISNKGYYIKGNSQNTFYLDQVISWSSGSFTSVLSTPSMDTVGGRKVAVISFNMKSVARPVLPAGYKFAIINTGGKVLYHSDETRNLNEDLLNEFADSSKLTSCIEGRSEGVFKTKYFSSEYNVQVKPLKDLPYFIVIFGDTVHQETRDIEIYSFTLSMMLLFFTFLIFQLLVIFVVSSKRSFFKKQLFTTSWIGPKVSSHHQYNLAILSNITIIILLILFFHLTSFLTYLFILLFSVTFISGFLNTVFIKRYRRELGDNFRFKKVALAWLIFLVLVINITAVLNLEIGNYVLFFIYQALMIAFGALYFYKGDKFVTSARNRSGRYLQSKWRYTRSFTLMALTRLIITSGIPIMFFYISSYNYEQNLGIRYNHSQYANGIIEKVPAAQLNSIDQNNLFNGIYYDGKWIDSITTATTIPTVTYSNEDKLSIRILRLFRLFITPKAVKEHNFYHTTTNDSSFAYNHLLHEAAVKKGGTTTYRKTSIPGQYLKLSSSGLNYDLPTLLKLDGIRNALGYWGILGVLVIVFFVLIYNIIHKLFALDLPDLDVWKELDNKILTDKKLNSLLFIIGLPGSGKVSLVLEKIRNKEIITSGNEPFIFNKDAPENNNVVIADLINIPDSGDDREKDKEWVEYINRVFDKKNRLVIVNHFEYNIQDAVTNRIKLNLLEKIMQENRCKIIILSTIHPVAFLDSILDPSVKPEDQSIPGQDLERWHVLLGHYRILVIPIEESVMPEKPALWEQPIYSETRSSHFLNRIQASALEVAQTLPEEQRRTKSDELAFKLQVTSHYFYMYIWQSLTKEEKFLLYDLAEDNLVNSFDDYNLSMLISKGIIIRRDGSLKLFNKGFRNFILTAIGNSEAMKIKNHIKDTGNWGKLKNPLIIVILAILAFLLASQEESYAQIITYITALAAGIPTLIKLLSVFDKDGAKSS